MLWLFCIGLAPSAAALELGDVLPGLNFAAEPDAFVYQPNGEMQMITVFLPSLESQKSGKFNQQVVAKGHCPLSIVDMQRRAWYAPEDKVREAVMQSQQQAADAELQCKVSIDEGLYAKKAWQLNNENTTIIVDGEGRLVFIAEGLLSDAQQQQVMQLLFAPDKN